jgi:hypothetical protein
VPSNLSLNRRRKAFLEGRRSAAHEVSRNPYQHPKLKELWELGRSQQRSGELKTPVPPRKVAEAKPPRPTRKPQQRSRYSDRPSRPNRYGGSSGGGFGGSSGGRFR